MTSSCHKNLLHLEETNLEGGEKQTMNKNKYLPFKAEFYRNMREGWNTVTCVDYQGILLLDRGYESAGTLIDEFEFGIPYRDGVILNYFSVQIGNPNGWTDQDDFEYRNIFTDKSGDWHRLSELTFNEWKMIGLKWRVYIHHDKKGRPYVIKFAPAK